MVTRMQVLTTDIKSLLEAEVVAAQLLFLVQHRVQLVYPGPEVSRVPTERDSQHVQEFIHAVHQALRSVGLAADTRLPFVNDHLIRQVGRHNEVMLHHERCLLVVQDEPLYHSGSDHPLLAVEVGGRLVDEVGVRTLSQGQDDRDSLQLSSREFLDLVINDVVELEGLGHF